MVSWPDSSGHGGDTFCGLILHETSFISFAACNFPYRGKAERLTQSAGVERAARYRYPAPLRAIGDMALTLANLDAQGTTPAAAALDVSNVQALYDTQ